MAPTGHQRLGAVGPVGRGGDRRGERRLLSEALAGWGESHPDVKVIEHVECGHPVDVLKYASAQADLLVVGSRGRGDLTGLLLGSVSHSLLHHATCPLVVSPGPAAPGLL